MVWWINKNESSNYRKGIHFGLKTQSDRIFQTVNIMLDLHSDNSFEIKSLLTAGVNTFNVDRTVFDDHYFKKVKQIIIDLESKSEIYQIPYYRPVSLAVTMSIIDPVNIDERVDIIILKEITKLEQLLDFRKQNIKLIPILLWLSLEMEDINELIKISDGVILDLEMADNLSDDLPYHLLQTCNNACRPVFLYKPKLIEGYFEDSGNDRQLLVTATQLVKNQLHGVVLVEIENLEKPPAELVQSLVKALHLVENDADVEKDYYKYSFNVKVPVTLPLSIALAASLAALKSGAAAIIVLTASGRSARLVAFASPPCQVLAVTARVSTARQLHLYRKVMPLLYKKKRAQIWQKECRNRIDFGTSFALKTGLFCSGAKLVVLTPSEEGTGYCDAFQIVTVPFRCDE